MAAPLGAQPAGFLRALGLRERCLYRYSERNPLLFILAAEFDAALDAHLVGDALYAVQCRHPLLSAHVKDDPDTGLGFYRADSVAPIDLTFLRDDYQDWQAVAAAELTRPFDSAAAPLIRATLVTQGKSSTLLLTFDHAISDGISSVLVLNDLLAALNGQPLPALPLPDSLEELAARRFDAVHIPAQSTDLGDPRMGVPTSIRTLMRAHRTCTGLPWAAGPLRALLSAAAKNAPPCMQRSSQPPPVCAALCVVKISCGLTAR